MHRAAFESRLHAAVAVATGEKVRGLVAEPRGAPILCPLRLNSAHVGHERIFRDDDSRARAPALHRFTASAAAGAPRRTR